MSLGAMASTRSSDISGKKHRAKLSSTTSQLQVESRRMEERLRVLKQMMSAEKTRREVEGGYLWESGQKGPLLRQAKVDYSPASNIKMTSAVTKSNGVQRLKKKEKIRVKMLTEATKSPPASEVVSRCGQCEKSTASLRCVECVENYCKLCYAKFHQKGALALHHAKPVINKSKIRNISPPKQVTNTVDAAASSATSSMATNDTGHPHLSGKPIENSLLRGSYDEEESAASFQQALAEWRAGGRKTTNASQSHNTRGSSTSGVSSAGIQAGPEEAMAVGKERRAQPRVQFSGNPRVSYLEQLMVRRNRYDPRFLKKERNILKMPSNEEDTSLEDIDDRGLPIEDDPLPEFNVFSDIELRVSESPCCTEIKACVTSTPDTPPAFSSSVEIVEIDDDQPNSSARQHDIDVKIQPINLGQVTSDRRAEPGKPSETKTTKRTTKRQKLQREKPKPKCYNSFTQTSSPPSTSVTSSVLSESDIQTSVKRAWTNCSEQPRLTQFFLRGVEADNYGGLESGTRNSKDSTAFRGSSLLSSTIWLPGNSVWSTAGTSRCSNPDTDFPPVVSRPKSQNRALPIVTAGMGSKYVKDASESDDEDDTTELELSVSNIDEEVDQDIWERQERDEDDQEALESLAWELASTVECEGRLTRCESDMDKLDSEIEATDPISDEGTTLELQGEQVFVLSDLSQVMSEFELYQKNLMEQDSD